MATYDPLTKKAVNQITYLKGVYEKGDAGQKQWAANEAKKHYATLEATSPSLAATLRNSGYSAATNLNRQVQYGGGGGGGTRPGLPFTPVSYVENKAQTQQKAMASLPGPVAQPGSSGNYAGVGLRSGIEGAGGTVTWQGEGKPILVNIGGKTTAVSDYTIGRDDKAYVSQAVLQNLLKGSGSGNQELRAAPTGLEALASKAKTYAYKVANSGPWDNESNVLLGRVGALGAAAAGAAAIPEIIAPRVAQYLAPAGAAASSLAQKGSTGLTALAQKVGSGFTNVSQQLGSRGVTALEGAKGVVSSLPTGVKVAAPVIGAGVLGYQALNGGQQQPGATPGQVVDNRTAEALRPTDTNYGTNPTTGNTMTPNYYAPNAMSPGTVQAPQLGQQPGQMTPQMPTVGQTQPVYPNPYQNVNQMQPPDFKAELERAYAEIDRLLNQNPVLSAAYLDQIQKVSDDYLAQLQQMGSTLDPATLAALKEIRDQVALRRQGLMEEMNRRGLLQSGIWLEEENRILNGQMSNEEKLLAGRLSDIQDRIMGAMGSLASQKMNLMGQAYQNQMQANQWAATQKLNLLNNVTQRADEWSRFFQEQAANQRKQQFEEQKWQDEAPYRNAQTQAALAQGQYYQHQANAPYRASSGSAPTATQQRNSALGTAYDKVNYALERGLSAAEIENNIRSWAGDLAREGVNYQDVIDYLYLRAGKTTSSNQPNNLGWYASLDQRLGGWLPGGV